MAWAVDKIMAILIKLRAYFKKPAVVHMQRALGNLAFGLSISWLILFLLEVWRPGLASLYLDLNLILVLALIVWTLSIIKFKEQLND